MLLSWPICAEAADKPIALHDLLGLWQSPVDGAKFELKPIDETHVLLLGKNRREWRGEYRGNKLTFTRTPTSDEINAAVPEWARRDGRVAGRLKWMLELQPGAEGESFTLEGNFFPGEVKWKEIRDLHANEIVSQEAWVTGAKGKPIPLTYIRPTTWAVADTLVLSAKPVNATAAGVATDVVLFAYGARLPVRKTQLTRVVSATSDITYEVLALDGETDGLSAADGASLFDGWKAAKQRVSAQDAETMTKNWHAVLLKAHVGPNVLPGRYDYAFGTNHAAWNLSHGTARARLRLERELNGAPREATAYAYVGEKIHARVDVMPRLLTPATTEIPLLIGIDGAFMRVAVDNPSPIAAGLDSNASTDSAVYTSPAIQLVPESDSRLGAGSRIGYFGGNLLLGVNPGDHVQIAFGDSRAFVTDATTQDLFVADYEEGLWVSALRRAALADQLSVNLAPQDLMQAEGTAVKEASNVILTQVAFTLLPRGSLLSRFLQWAYHVSENELHGGRVIVSNKITLGNQAAAMLLRDEFIERMQPLIDRLNGLTDPDDQVTFLDAMKSEILNERSAIGNIEMEDPRPVSDPTGDSMGMRTKLTLRDLYRVAALPNRAADFARQRRDWVLAGFAAYRASVLGAQKKAIDTKDGDFEGLLGLTADCFEPVVATLVPKLVRPVHDAQGNLSWEPDPIARAEVRELTSTWEAIRAQREWSSIDSDVAITSATLALQGAGPLASWLGRVNAGLNIAVSLHAVGRDVATSLADVDKALFAIGASHVLGNERFDLVQQQKTSAWSVALNLVGLGLAAGDVPTLMGRAPEGVAFSTALQAARKVRQDGIETLKLLAVDEQASLLAAAAAIEIKTATKTTASLTPAEKEIAAELASIQQELKARGGFRIDLDATPTTRVSPEGKIETLSVSNTEAPAEPPPSLPEKQPISTSDLAVGEPNAVDQAVGTAYDYDLKKWELQPPAGFPQRTGAWCSPDGKTFQLGYMREGMFMSVYEEIGTQNVVKVCKWIGKLPPELADKAIANGQQVYREMSIARDLLERESIPYLKVEFGPPPGDNEVFWLRQEKFPEGCHVPSSNLLLSEAERTSVMDVMEKLYRAKLVAEDFKVDNIVLVKDGERWITKISDVDRVCRWGEFTDSIETVARILEGVGGRWTRGVVRPGNYTAGKRLLTLEEFFKVQLAKGGWLNVQRMNGKLQWSDGVLKADEVFQRFRWIRNPDEIIDLHDRIPMTAKPANPTVGRTQSPVRFPAPATFRLAA